MRSYFRSYGLPVSITNCSNNYGPYQFPEKLILLAILSAVNGWQIPIYGDGKQIRDWLYVEDHCEAIWLVVKKSKPGEAYNIGGGNQVANIDLVRQICSILDELLLDSEYCPHELLLTYIADRPGHDRRYAMDIAKINRDLGWKPKEQLNSGLRKTIQWYLESEDWIESIISKPQHKAWLEKNYKKR